MKNNSKTFILLGGIVLACIITIATIFMIYSYSGRNTGKYGDRLKGIEKVELTKKNLTDIEEKAKEQKGIKSANVNLHGKIINIIMYLDDESTATIGVNVALTLLETFEEDILSFYDIQYYITKEELSSEDKTFPVIGYKNNDSSTISWTNYSS